MKKEITTTKNAYVTVCDICSKEIDPCQMPFTLDRIIFYDGGNVFKDLNKYIFNVPRKKKTFHFHEKCAEDAILEKMKRAKEFTSK